VDGGEGPTEHGLLSEEEVRADQAKDRRWQIDDLVKKGGKDGEFLRLNAEQALKLQVAQLVVKDVKELYAHYGVKPGSIRETGPDWLDDVAAFLRLPAVRMLLVMIGIVCLMLELKMPGVSLPIIIAAICFVLFFWAHWDQGITMLALLLFVLGLVLIILEIFVIPGFGITGISGIILVLLGLGLATLENIPQTTQEWMTFGNTLTTFGLGLVGAVAVALVIGRYLPHIPVANRLVLAPPGEKSDELMEVTAEPPHERAALLGAIGVAATTLRPAGMAQFGDQYIDVVAEGSYLPAGTRVQVVEIEGNRIAVKEV